MRFNYTELYELRNLFPEESLHKLDALLTESDTIDLEPWAMAERVGLDEKKTESLLHALEKKGLLTKKIVRHCHNCEAELKEEDIERGKCLACGSLFPDGAQPYEERVQYSRTARRSHDIGWVIALHGMNTRGRWQQELQWLIDLTYRRSIPYANWKYGKVWFTPIVIPLQRRMIRTLINRLREYQNEVKEQNEVSNPPDVIAHSFGTWLLGHALQEEPNLKVGYVVLTGCILRPDFDWKGLVDRGQVKAILNHYGLRDNWAKIAVYCIPDAGPAGRIGFLKPVGEFLYDISEPDFAHSDFFNGKKLKNVFETFWQPFFRGKIEDIVAAKTLRSHCAGWRPPPLLIRAPGSQIVIGLILVAFLAFIVL
jgi:hypothetical protein